MNAKKQLICLSTALLLSSGIANAQEEQRVKKDYTPSVPKVSGLINARYSYNDDATKANSFDLRRVRLAVGGNFGKTIDYKLQAEYETSVKIIDVYVRFKPTDAFNVQIGEFKTEYSQESQDGPATWLTIENPTVINKLTGYNDVSGLSSNSRDVGIRLYGNVGKKEGYHVFGYKVGVYNGNGINLKDNDEYKNVAAFVTVNPIKHLTLSAGQYIGHYTPKAVEADSIKAGASVNDNAIKRNRTSAGFTYNNDKAFVRSEYLYGKTGDIDQQGAFITAAYKFKHGIQPVLSYGFYQKDKSSEFDIQHDYTIGINWQPIKYVRGQLNYTYTNYANSNKPSGNLVEAQLIATF